jgi:hypothetical protein
MVVILFAIIPVRIKLDNIGAEILEKTAFKCRECGFRKASGGH